MTNNITGVGGTLHKAGVFGATAFGAIYGGFMGARIGQYFLGKLPKKVVK